MGQSERSEQKCSQVWFVVEGFFFFFPRGLNPLGAPRKKEK